MPPKKRRNNTLDVHPETETKTEAGKVGNDNERSQTNSSRPKEERKLEQTNTSADKAKKTEGNEEKIQQKGEKDIKVEPTGQQGKKRTFEQAGGALNVEAGEKGKKKRIQQNGKKKHLIIAGETVDDQQTLETRMKKFGTPAAIDDNIPAIYREPLPVRHQSKSNKHKRHPTRPIKRRFNPRNNKDNRSNTRDHNNKEEKTNPVKEKTTAKTTERKTDSQPPPQPRRQSQRREHHHTQSVRRRHHSPEYDRSRPYDNHRYDSQRKECTHYERDRYKDREDGYRYKDREDRYRSDRQRHDSYRRRHASPSPSPSHHSRRH